jgi:hypothetical protein
MAAKEEMNYDKMKAEFSMLKRKLEIMICESVNTLTVPALVRHIRR